MSCPPESTDICNKLEREFVHSGEVIASNLVLNTNIVVEVIYEPLGEDGEKLGGTTPTLMKFVSPQDQVERLYPTALLKQLSTGIDFGEDADIKISINSDVEEDFWFPGDGDIKPTQVDVSLLSLHEMVHGLGFSSTWEFPPDRETFITPRLNGDDDIDEDDPITFDGFYETVFDANLVHLEDPNNPNSAKRITDIAKSLNGFTPKGTNFPNVATLFDRFEESNQVNDAKLMLTHATTKSALAFMPPGSLDPFVLDTSEQEFSFGTSINHFDQDTFINTADFLMVPTEEEGVTLQAHLQRTGNNPGGGIGPKLRSVLKTLGYTVNANPPMGSTSTLQKRRFTRRNNQRKSRIRF
ncbi:hypothetical protein C1646_802880 [Rhizophagus diaphanus]|nr:hypothetical protein C1646_802880 [Rhizophagus diaphanus] [Rhizophagus sp. MUCL 43196]